MCGETRFAMACGETCDTRVAKYKINIVTYNILLKYRMRLLLFSFVVALYVRRNKSTLSTYFVVKNKKDGSTVIKMKHRRPSVNYAIKLVTEIFIISENDHF